MALALVCGADLLKMMNHMGKVIGRDETKSRRLIGADAANSFQLGSGQASDYVSEVAIVSGPQRDQQRPISFLRRLDSYVSLLVVTWKIQRWLLGGADKSLVVIGCRINQMSNHLLGRPTAG